MSITDIPEGEPVVVISPHLDDGVFGCGQLLALHPRSAVVTVFAGRPRYYNELTVWDAAAGFQPSDDVVALRREEDRAALALLDARPIWLDFLDAQYGDAPAAEALAGALEEAILAAAARVVVMPLGLFHSDHKLTHEAALRVMRRQPRLAWFAYEEPVYRGVLNLLEERLTMLQRDGIVARPAGSLSERGRQEKRQAVEQYRSQLRALSSPGYPGYEAVFEAERYWRLILGIPAPNDSRRRAGSPGA